METDFHIRHYLPSDADTLQAWADAHGSRFDARLLPPCGVIVERCGQPAAAMFVHLCLGVGVGVIDYLFTVPGLHPSEAAECLGFGLEAVRKIAADHDTGILIAYAPPAIARYAANMGFHVASEGLTQLWTVTT